MSIDKNVVRTKYEKGGYTYQSVADKFNISVNTVKSWAKRDKDEGNPWTKGNNKKVATKEKKLQLSNKVATKKEKVEKPSIEVVKDIDKEIVEEETEESNITLTKYDTNVKDRLLEVEAWARDGLIDEQIAHNLGIALSTFYEYKKKHPDFSESLKRGKEVVDIEVENALLKRALGYQYTEVKREKSGFGTKVTETTKEVQPDTTAQIFWLKNRKPIAWRDKQEIAHEGNMNINNPCSELTTDELKKLIKMGETVKE